MAYTIEKLRMMPMNFLQGIDIQSKEEELLVQKVLDEKRSSMPVGMNMDIPSYKTDPNVLGADGEAKLQAEIDAKKAEARARFIPQEEVISEVTATELVPLVGEVTSTNQTQEIVKKPFCEFCDSKGVRHKKNCTREQ